MSEMNSMNNEVSQSQIHDNLPEVYKNLDPSKNKSRPIMTKYEYTLVKGLRKQQLNENMMPYVDIKGLKEHEKTIDNIFKLEFEAKQIPFIISRPIGNKTEYWRLCDLSYGEIVDNFLNKDKPTD